jgi:uncharacterized protein
MKFAAVIEYSRDANKIAEVRPRHRQYLATLLTDGRLVAAGPFTDDSGALIIYEAPTREDAEKLVLNDPFYDSGIFLHYTLRPWNPVMANRALFPG